MAVRSLDAPRRDIGAATDRERPVAIFVGKGGLPGGGDALDRKLAIMARDLAPIVIGVADPGVSRGPAVRVIRFPDLRPRLLGGAVFYALAPTVALALAAGRPGCAIVCQSPFEGVGTVALSRLLPRSRRPSIVIEAHGDWGAAARLYGSPARRFVAGAAERLARWAFRRADLVRAVSGKMEDLVRQTGYRGEVLRFPTYSDYGVFTETPVVPMPPTRTAVYVGVLETTKGVDVLIDAWPSVVRQLPDAKLVVVGGGPRLAAYRDRAAALGCAPSVDFAGPRPREEVRDLLDASSLLVLPSRTEGLPRVVSEAFARGRPVVATAVGGTPELVDHGRNGLLVPPADADSLAEALTRALGDPDLLRRMGREARSDVMAFDPTARYAEGLRRLADWIVARGAPRDRMKGQGA